MAEVIIDKTEFDSLKDGLTAETKDYCGREVKEYYDGDVLKLKEFLDDIESKTTYYKVI